MVHLYSFEHLETQFVVFRAGCFGPGDQSLKKTPQGRNVQLSRKQTASPEAQMNKDEPSQRYSTYSDTFTLHEHFAKFMLTVLQLVCDLCTLGLCATFVL